MPRHFGHPPGVVPGAHFRYRVDLSAAGVHRPRIAGISGSQREGCDSIVVCDGYEDDLDEGHTLLYTGEGGRSRQSGKQACDQDLTRGNKALALSCARELPVRVSRGPMIGSPFAPAEGYRYDGLYLVESYWEDVGRSGFRIYRFRLVRDHTSA